MTVNLSQTICYESEAQELIEYNPDQCWITGVMRASMYRPYTMPICK